MSWGTYVVFPEIKIRIFCSSMYESDILESLEQLENCSDIIFEFDIEDRILDLKERQLGRFKFGDLTDFAEIISKIEDFTSIENLPSILLIFLINERGHKYKIVEENKIDEYKDLIDL